jgi:hypothetical protein
MGGFSLGRVCATRGVAADMEKDAGFAAFVAASLNRYVLGDWGDVSAADWAANDQAVECGGERILAAYCWPGHGGLKIWVLTEADHSVTTVLYPEEY